MTHAVSELAIGYVFSLLLFAGLPAIVFLIVFLPGLMRTTGETIGAAQSEAQREAQPDSADTPSKSPQTTRAAALTMANTA
jgi:Sec-independent protein translocase protein TatA